MATSDFLSDLLTNLPDSFFQFIVQDMEISRWVQLFREQPALREAVFEGFSAQEKKMAKALRQPQIQKRIVRLLRADEAFLRTAAEFWAEDNLEILAYLDMLDEQFVLENAEDFKNLIGPERLLLVLLVLERLQEKWVERFLDPDFWPRNLNERAVEMLLPLQAVSDKVLREKSEAREIFGRLGIRTGLLETPVWEEGDSDRKKGSGKESVKSRQQDRIRKLESKIEKLNRQLELLTADRDTLRRENKKLREAVSQWEIRFDAELQRRLQEERRRWYARFESPEAPNRQALEKASRRLDELFVWADRALSLQQKADAEYGLVGEVREKLIRIELYLREVERIFTESLVVHSEVRHLKNALVEERKRILSLPGIHKALKGLGPEFFSDDLMRRIRLLEPDPKNLAVVNRLESTIREWEALGFVKEAESLLGELGHKRRQILETIYASFETEPEKQVESRNWKNLDEFVRSGESRKYDLYVDGYNILVRFLKNKERSGPDLTDLRMDFIEAVEKKRRHFRNIFLVFDGLEDSRERRNNVEIVYTNKLQGITADAALVDGIARHGNGRVLLVTEDQEIIRAVERKIYALIRPVDFYMFVYDLKYLWNS